MFLSCGVLGLPSPGRWPSSRGMGARQCARAVYLTCRALVAEPNLQHCPSLLLRTVTSHTPTTRMEIRTWRSAIADLRGSPPGAPSGALGEGIPGWVWRCDAAISRYHQKICLFVRFSRAAKTPKWRRFRSYRRFSAMFEQAELRGIPVVANGPSWSG